MMGVLEDLAMLSLRESVALLVTWHRVEVGLEAIGETDVAVSKQVLVGLRLGLLPTLTILQRAEA